MKFVNIGFNNMVAVERVVALITSDSAPAKRLIAESKDNGRAVDCTCGRRTRSVIITDSDHIILSALQAETVAGRLSGDEVREDIQEEEA